MPLPLVTTPDDVKKLVRYLAPKPSGVTLKEAKAVVGSSLIDGRKIAVYQVLGVISREGERIKLTADVGRPLARSDEGEFAKILRQRIAQIPAYRGCLEWAYHQRLKEVTASEVGAHWHDNYRSDLGTDNEHQIAQRAVCFLQFAAGAALGKFVIGRRGQPSRLVVSPEVLEAFVNREDLDLVTSGEEIEDGGTPVRPPPVETPKSLSQKQF